MTTQEIIDDLRAWIPLSPTLNEFINRAADRLEELQRLNDSMQVDRDLWIKVGREKLQTAEKECAEVERIRKALHDALAEISRLEKMTPVISRTAIRPEPSRLEIAAILLAAWEANPEIERARVNQSNRVFLWSAKLAIEEADALIAAAKEGK